MVVVASSPDRYEDLVASTVTQVARMLAFLNIKYSLHSLTDRLSHDFVTFKRRRHTSVAFDCFTLQQREFVSSVVHATALKLGSTGHELALGVREYLGGRQSPTIRN